MTTTAEGPQVQARTSSRAERLRGPIVTIATLSAATLALRLRDPHHSGSWGLCPLYAMTGLYCPGCGGLRAVNDLTHGDVGAALSSNLLVTLAIPVAIILLVLSVVRAWRGPGRPRRTVPPRLMTALWAGAAIVVAAFSILRNTPWGNWLAPV